MQLHHSRSLLRLASLLAIASCSSTFAQSRLYGPAQPARDPGCRLELVQGPTSRPAFAIGEASCTLESEGDRIACQEQIRERLCEMGADAIAPQSGSSGRIVAIGLKFGSAGGSQQAWQGPPQQQMQQQPPPPLGPPQGPPQQLTQQPPPPAGAAQCNPPCPAGTRCSADGRRCESASAAATSLTEEQITEALDRVRRRVLRCRRREDGDAPVTVEVEIEPAGSVSSVRIDGPIANSNAGPCIEQAVFRATFPTFEGANRTVRHSFVPSQ